MIFQEDIPVSVYHATIKTPGPFAFRRIKRGYFEIQPEERVERRSLGVNYNVKTSYGTSSQNSRNAQMSFAEIITEYYKSKFCSRLGDVGVQYSEGAGEIECALLDSDRCAGERQQARYVALRMLQFIEPCKMSGVIGIDLHLRTDR